MMQRIYICIDLKSFYASVECVERGLNPMTARLVVADPQRSEKTICLAVTPALKRLGVGSRCRVFEIPPGIDYIMAPPRMKLYIDYSAGIYGIYLKYISKDDIHVYSIDEAFMDVTRYLKLYNMDAKTLAEVIMKDVYDTFGIRAACGIGTNLYLAKIALDIMAKHSDEFIGYLDEDIYRENLWNHRPLADFWRIGKKTAATLERYGITTMGKLAQTDEDFLYRVFGIDAELLIDHAYGRETTTIEDIKQYKSKSNSISSGQVLPRDYEFEESKIIIKEMVDAICLDLVEKRLVTKSVTIAVGYGRIYGEGGVHATCSFDFATNAQVVILPAVVNLYESVIDKSTPVRRITLSCNQVEEERYRQYSLFVKEDELERDRRLSQAIISIKNRYGKNAVLRGMNFLEGATAIERNMQIGGHKSGEETEK